MGFLYGAVGAGALLGAYALARVPDRHLLATPVVAALGFGAVADRLFPVAYLLAVARCC